RVRADQGVIRGVSHGYDSDALVRAKESLPPGNPTMGERVTPTRRQSLTQRLKQIADLAKGPPVRLRNDLTVQRSHPGEQLAQVRVLAAIGCTGAPLGGRQQLPRYSPGLAQAGAFERGELDARPWRATMLGDRTGQASARCNIGKPGAEIAHRLDAQDLGRPVGVMHLD